MFGIGPTEIAIAAVVAVLLFGKKLPELAHSLGAAIPSFKSGLSDIRNETKTIEQEIKNVDKS